MDENTLNNQTPQQPNPTPSAPSVGEAPVEVPPVESPQTTPPPINPFAEQQPAPAAPMPDIQKVDSSPANNTYQSTLVTPLRTYELDAAQVLKKKDGSIVKIQQAEQKRQEERKEQPSPIVEHHKKVAVKEVFIALLVIIGAGALFFAYLSLPKEEKVELPLSIWKPFPEDEIVTLENNDGNTFTLEEEIESLKSGASPVNTVTRVIVVEQFQTPEGESVREILPVNDFLRLTGVRVPPTLARSLTNNYMFGLIDGSQGREPFILTEIDFYENAFAGMLAWEETMATDLAPLFGEADLYKYDNLLEEFERAFEETVNVNEETEETTEPAQSEATEFADVVFSANREEVEFRDHVIQNRDTRILSDDVGTPVLLYSFINRTTLVITTSRDSFEVLLDRLYNSSRRE